MNLKNTVIALVVFIAIMAIIGNLELYLETLFPDPYEK